ncbi:MAG TPA: TetR/AcrR family transcriptional regulator [Acidimicrobiales bacterium]|jgi:AcrR family transcriptional regulator|nr:TetR/AcrR family transcriptional regulator [Acidimicrobiales bacterium]
MSERPGKAAILRAAVAVMGEDGYEGASMRDMAARAGVSVAALYYHFPSKHDLLREFLDEAYDVTLARIDRRLASAGDGPAERLDSIVSTLIWSHLHDDFAQLASNVAMREYTRLNPPERAAIEVKRKALLDLVEGVVGEMGSADPREAARAIITLATSLVEPYVEIGRSLDDVIALYQGFARALARGS